MSTHPPASRRALSSIAAWGVGVLDGVLEQRVERRPQPLGVGQQPAGGQLAQPPGPRGDLRPAHEHILQQRLELELGDLHEVGLVGRRQHQQPLDDRVDASELVEGDVDLGPALAVAVQQLEVATGDRHRGAQLVGGVVDEALLALEHRAPLLGQRLGDPGRLDPPARVPDHRQEHGRHQRHLEQLAPQLDALEGVEPDRHRRDRHDARQHDPASSASARPGTRRGASG